MRSRSPTPQSSPAMVKIPQIYQARRPKKGGPRRNSGATAGLGRKAASVLCRGGAGAGAERIDKVGAAPAPAPRESTNSGDRPGEAERDLGTRSDAIRRGHR